jgi:MerR family copper efflux transcriptional regulator
VEETDWLTLPDAAQQLGVSPRTIRRWIKEGKVRAELRPGPYGQQYYVPATQVRTAQEVHEVVRVERPVELADLARALDGYLGERESALVSALESLRAEVRQATERQEEREAALRQEFRAVLTAVQDLAEQERQRASAAEVQGATWQERARQLELENVRLQERLPSADGATFSSRSWWQWWRH